MKFKRFLSNVAVTLGAVILISSIEFIYYGLKTRCPDVAIYMYCSPENRK